MYNWEFNGKKERGASWYTVAIIIGLSMIIWGFIMGLYIMSIVVFIFAGVYVLMENNSPDIIKVEINENGIGIGDTFYDYAKIESFSIIYDGNYPYSLRLKLKTKGFKDLDIFFSEDVNIAGLRAFLLEYVLEDEKGELKAMDKIIRMLKL